MMQRAVLRLYLNELDQFIKRELHCPAYLRYVDDLLLFSNDKRQLWAWKAAINGFLPRLRLTLHQAESTVYPTGHGIPFLGFVSYPDHRLLKRRNGLAFARRLKAQLSQLAAGQLTYADVAVSVQGWVAHAAHADTYGLRRALLTEQLIPRRGVTPAG